MIPTTMPTTVTADNPVGLMCAGILLGMSLGFVAYAIGFWWGMFGRAFKAAAD